MLMLCNILNVPIKPSKVEGPTTSLTFLGVHLNTITMEASMYILRTSERKQSLLQELSALRICTQQMHKTGVAIPNHETLILV